MFQSKRMDRTIAARLHQDLIGDKKQVAAFFDFLLARRTTMQFGEMFETEARREMITASMGSDELFAREVKDEGWHAVAEPWRAAGNPNSQRHAATDDDGVVSATLQEVYQDYCKRRGVKARSQQKLVKALQAQFGKRVKVEFKRLGGINRRVWVGLSMHAPIDNVIGLPGRSSAEPQNSVDNADFGT